MDREQLNEALVARLGSRLERMGLQRSEVNGSLDLVRTGILDSLGFVDLITELEGETGKQVDLEKAFDRPGATTVGGVLDLFINGQ